MITLITLPFEVIEYIFSLCLPSDTFIIPDPLQAPLLLAQICSRWRQAVLSATGLWSSLSLQKRGERAASATLILETWLDRSRTRPLYLSIPRVLLQHHPIQALFVRCSPRWKHIKTSVDYSDSGLWGFEPVSAPLEPLEFLEILHLKTRAKGLHPVQADQLSIALQSAPRLKHLTWESRYVPVPNINTSLDIDWSRLTSVQITCSTDWVPIFTYGQNLVYLLHGHVSSIFLRPAGTRLVPNVLQHLRTLIMRVDEESLEALYHTLTLPSLTYFEVFFKFGALETSRVAQLLLGFLERSRCPLEHLDLHNHPLTESMVIQSLRCVQGTLRELTLENNNLILVGDTLLSLLSRQSATANDSDPTAPPCLCPKLVSLALYNCLQCTTGALARMLESRQTHSAQSSIDPIQLLEIYETDDELEYLLPLRSEGLIIKMYSHDTLDLLPMDPDEEARLERMYEDGFPKPQQHILSSE